MRNANRVVAILVVCALCLLAFLWLHGSSGDEEARPPVTDGETEPASPPILEGASSVAPLVSSQPVPDDVRIHGRIVFPGTEESAVRVVATPVLVGEQRGEPASAAAAGGRYEVRLRRSALIGARDLEVRAEHPLFLGGHARVPVTRQAGMLPTEIRVDLRLAAAGLAVGRVVNEHGRPVKGVLVASYPLAPARVVAHVQPRALALARPSATTTSDEDGRFSLRLLPGRLNIVATLVQGRVGGAARVDAQPARKHWVGELVVRPGVEISGTVRSAASLGPLGNVRVSAESTREAEQLLVSDAVRLALRGDRVAELRASTRSHKDGSYMLHASSSDAHEVELPDFGGGSPIDTGALGTVRRTVTPPAGNVDFEVGGAQIRVRVTSAGRPVSSALVGSPSSPSWSTNSAGVATYRVTPGRATWVGVVARGHAFQRRRVTPGPVGTMTTVRFELQSLADIGGTISLRFTPGAYEALRECGTATMPAGLRAASPTNPHVRIRDVDVEEAGCRIEGVEAGRRRIVIRPGSGFLSDTGYYLEHETLVDVRAGEVTEVRLRLAKGGRLRVAARAPDGGYLPASCAVLGAGDRPIAGAWRSGPRARHESALLRTDAPTDRVSPLPPGTYRLRFFHRGFKEAFATARIEAGKVALADVQLVPIDR